MNKSMTLEQKSEWVKNASNEELLGTYYMSARLYDAFDAISVEDCKLCKNEILHRMNNNNK